MMRRRGGTNKLKQPKKDKNQKKVEAKKKNVAELISGDLPHVGTTDESNATNASENASSENIPTEVAGPSTSVRESDTGFGAEFVFKRPKTPPPKMQKKGSPISRCSGMIENRRIRSKSKPGKTGFPIGASLHGLSKSEKQERRNREKSRSPLGGPHEPSQSSHKFTGDIFDNEYAGEDFQTEEGHRELFRPYGAEHVVSYPRQTVTKLKFPPPRQRSSSEKRSRKSHDSLEQGVKESLEICQGLSKVKIEDWYPLYDHHHAKLNAANVGPSTASAPKVEKVAANVTEKEDSDDEWEESLVYVDLEDIPDVDSLFSSLGSRRRRNDEEGESESEVDSSLSQLEMKIYNLNTELPVLLIGGKYLAGNWDNGCGTSLFFKKKSENDLVTNGSSSSEEKPHLENIIPEPEIPFDPIFGKNVATPPEDGYELVAKSLKVLKARYFPAVNEELKGEDVIRDADDEFDQRDFQIPPVSMVREFLPSKVSYEAYAEQDLDRRRLIQEKWPKKKEADSIASNIVKTEPLDRDDEDYDSDTEDLDNILILDDENEPLPSTSRSVIDNF